MTNLRHSSLQEVIALLDEGVHLYRRYLSTFALLAALFSLPALVITFNLLFSLDAKISEAFIENLLLIMISLLLTPLPMIPPLTRATRMALDGQPPALRSILWRWPQIGRWMIAGFYGGFMALMWVSVLTTVGGVISGAICSFLFLAAGFSTLLNSSALIVLIPLLFIVVLVVYFLYLVLCGSGLFAALYSIQPLLDDSVTIGSAFQLSQSLLFKRPFSNVLVFFCAALVFSVVSVIVTLTIGVLLPMPFALLFGAEHPLTRGLGAVAWVIGLTAAMPLLPIWSTLHYRRMLVECTGADLARRIQQAAASGVRLTA